MFDQSVNDQQQPSGMNPGYAPQPMSAPQAPEGMLPATGTPDPAPSYSNPSDMGAPMPPTSAPEPVATSPTDMSTPSSPTNDALLSIKQDALTHLGPLVNHLEQSPEEKFRTTMMMIQASDNQDLIKVAYDAAQEISDDKARAQALLDVVNEINYFTQQHNQ